ncbi:MAG: M28 family peptidase [Chitinophagaceae bacterium]|nr:M28 family peptidase [Chitinophagaceae bacterium]
MRLLIFMMILIGWKGLIAQSKPDSLRKHVVKLCAYPTSRSMVHPVYLTKAGGYIEKNFRSYSSRVQLQKYVFREDTVFNVMASFGPEDAPRLIIGAHYNVSEGVPGADGNASGVSCLIELARLLQRHQGNLEIRIDLVAFTLGGLEWAKLNFSGSNQFAKSLIEDSVSVLGMLNLDAVGFYSDAPGSQHYPMAHYAWMHGRRGNFLALILWPGTGLFPRVMRGLLMQYTTGLRVVKFKPIVPFEGFTDGDHMNFIQYKIPAMLLTNTRGFRNKYFNHDLDTYETLDYFRLSKTTDMLYRALIRYRP